MEVVLFRHGIAVERGTPGFEDDASRPLTRKGWRRTETLARGLARLVSADLILTSPYLRARQTAEILARRLEKKVQDWDLLVPEADPGETARALEELRKERVVLVGHEPHLSELAAHLLGGGAGLALKKGGACCLRVKDGRAELRWWLSPRVLLALTEG